MESIAEVRSQLLRDPNTSQEDEIEVDGPPPKRTQRSFDWDLLRTFSNLDEAKHHVKEARTWKLRYTRNLNEGTKHLYDCSYTRECPSKIFIMKRATNENVDLYSNEEEHDHDGVTKIGLAYDTKEKIKALYANGVTRPKRILTALRKDGIEPKRRQIASYVQHNIRRKEGPRVVSLGQMKALCLEKSHIPDTPDASYVLDHDINFDDGSFKIVLTTKRLLALISNSDAIQADGTYKLMWEGFPVLRFGASDKNKKFHPFCVAITSNETKLDYAFCFQALKKSKEDYCPTTLIADCADSISNGFASVFGTEFIRVNCWAHVYRNLRDSKYLKSISIDIRADILTDISLLQLSRCKDEFLAAVKLFVKKWQNTASNFCEHFTLEYVEKNAGWYEGVASGYPSTNNGLEATNRVIKSEGAFHERVGFGFLVQSLSKVLQGWSEERNPSSPNFKDFSVKPTYNLKLQTAAFQWNKSTEIKYRTSADKQTKFYFIPSTGSAKLRDIDIDKYIRMYTNTSWKAFEGYKRSINRMWKVEMKAENWEDSTRTCPSFQKDYICKHLIGVAIRNRSFEVRPDAKAIPIGAKRKRGRPEKAKRALIVQ